MNIDIDFAHFDAELSGFSSPQVVRKADLGNPRSPSWSLDDRPLISSLFSTDLLSQITPQAAKGRAQILTSGTFDVVTSLSDTLPIPNLNPYMDLSSNKKRRRDKKEVHILPLHYFFKNRFLQATKHPCQKRRVVETQNEPGLGQRSRFVCDPPLP